MQPHLLLHSALFSMTMGVQPLHDTSPIEVDPASYVTEIALKYALLADNHRFYFQALPETEALQWDAVAFLLPEMARHYPHYFTLEVENGFWHWRNMLLNAEHRFRYGDSSTLPHAPLDWLGRQVQEDLLLLDGNRLGVPLVAGQLCFANAWCLDDKMDQSFLAIHRDVPLFQEQIGAASQRLMERIKPGRPLWRVNWAIKATNLLNVPPHINAALAPLAQAVTTENAGERCFFRIERQTLARLPNTNGVLFTVRTYRLPIAELVQIPDQACRLLGTLRTASPETLEYKGIAPFATPLVAYLERYCAERSDFE